MKHELEIWWQHPTDHQTTMYQCSCGYKTSGKAWIDNHVKESNSAMDRTEWTEFEQVRYRLS